MPALSLKLNFPRILINECGSFIEYSLVNTTSQPLASIRLRFLASLLGLDTPIEIPSLEPGEERQGIIDIQLKGIGAKALRITTEYAREREMHQWEGAIVHPMVYGQPQSPANISVIIHDIQSNRSTGTDSELGAIKGDVNISVSNLMPKVETLTDLLNIVLPVKPLAVAFHRTELRDHFEILTIPSAFLSQNESASVLHLTPSGETASANVKPLAWRLCASSSILLGRGSQTCDLVTRFTPSTPENDERSKHLSRECLRLNVDNRHKLRAENITPNASFAFGKSPLPPGANAELNPVDTISLGVPPWDYQLRARIVCPVMPRLFRVANLALWAGHRFTQGSIALADDEPDWGHALIDLANNSPSLWQLRWFHRQLPFGSSSSTPFYIPNSELQAQHGYLHHLRGCFWIENASAQTLSIDDHELSHGQIAPLRHGTNLSLGGKSFVVTRVR